MQMPALTTDRLLIRPVAPGDLQAVFQILDVAIDGADADSGPTLAERREWLDWSVRNERALARLYQPPYGDRAVVLRATDELIGAVGYVPCLMPFGQLPGFAAERVAGRSRLATAELGLYWAISPRFQGQGYATEAGAALIQYAFGTLKVERIIATTEYDNAASIGVMRKLGMRIERNPEPEPPYLQVVGVLRSPAAGDGSAS